MKFFAAPVSSYLYDNYNKSVVDGIMMDDNKLSHLWGLKKSKLTVWNKIQKNDIILFYHSKYFISYSRVLHKEHNDKIAEKLWGFFSNKYYTDYSWPLLIYLTKPVSCYIPFQKVGKILDYDSKYFLRSFFELNKNLKDYINEKYKDFNDFALNESEKSYEKAKVQPG